MRFGGPEVHAKNGVVDNLVADEAAAFAEIRRFLSYLPPNVWELAPCASADDPADRRAEELITIVPRNRRQLYDMRQVISLVLDEGSFFEISAAAQVRFVEKLPTIRSRCSAKALTGSSSMKLRE